MGLYQEHTCPECGRKAIYYAVNPINQQAPCIDCQLGRNKVSPIKVEKKVVEVQGDLFRKEA